MPKKFTPKSADERHAEAAGIHALLVAQVEHLKTTEGWRMFLTMATRFHTYSLNNQMLILAQMPNATRVAGYRAWQELGQQVKKGEKSIRIFGFAKRTEDVVKADGTTVKEDRIYFPLVSVFDASQTEPMEGGEPLPTGGALLEGDEAAGLASHIRERLTAEGFTIQDTDPGLGALACVDETWTIRVSPGLSPNMSASALLHEAAHAYLGHAAAGTNTMYRQHRGLAEVEAESAGHVAAHLLGLDSSAWTVNYVAEWGHTKDIALEDTAARVLKTANGLYALITDGTPPTRLEWKVDSPAPTEVAA